MHRFDAAREKRHEEAVKEAWRVLRALAGRLQPGTPYERRDAILFALLAFADREACGEWSGSEKEETGLPEVHLQFTQEDRDLLLRIDQRLESFVSQHAIHDRRLNNHSRRLRKLEAIRDEGKGLMRAFRAVWAAIAALAGLVGWHIRQH